MVENHGSGTWSRAQWWLQKGLPRESRPATFFEHVGPGSRIGAVLVKSGERIHGLDSVWEMAVLQVSPFTLVIDRVSSLRVGSA